MKSSHHTHNSDQTRIAILENTVSHIDKTLERLEKNMINGFSEVRNEINDIRKTSNDQFKWIIGTILFSVILPIALKIFHLG